MKITGAEWKRFEEQGWPQGYIWADETTLDDGRELYDESKNGEVAISDAETFVVPDWWTVIYEGPTGVKIDSGDGLTVRSLIRKWRKARDFEVLVVSVPRGQADAAKALLSERGWRIS